MGIFDKIKSIVAPAPKQTVIQPIVFIDKSKEPSKPMEYITKADILMGREKEYPLTKEIEANLELLWKALNKLGEIYHKDTGKNLPGTSSGYRPGKYNVAAGGAKASSHLVCKAWDAKDGDGEFDKWCTANQKALEDCGLWQEHPDDTKGWCHLDIATRSARPKGTVAYRTFKP